MKKLSFCIPQTKTDLEKFKLPTPNSMISGHFSVKAAAVRKLEHFFLKRIAIFKRPIFDRAVIVYTCYRNQFRDEDNIYGGLVKVINDALVNIGILATDKYPNLHSVVRQIKCKKSEQRILVEIFLQPTDQDFRTFIHLLTGREFKNAT